MKTLLLALALLGGAALAALPSANAQAVAETTAAANAPTAAGVEYFEKHVRPLLIKRCYSCHSAAADEREGGLVLDSRQGWLEGGESGPAIVAGDPEASRLIHAVRYTDLEMPPDRRLSAEEVGRLEEWVRLGAPDPRDQAVSPQAPGPSAADPIAGREHWAFQPLRDSLPPAVAQPVWSTAGIDRFVLQRLEAAALQPATDAERGDLIRRLYFQLSGLPPTPQQVDEFQADVRPDAVERVVDRLLLSPAFGERWGRHWLDLARYADSNGLDENFLFREAWRYRNWVIAALNDDMPFDRFVLEQIAGDLLPFDSIEQRDRQRIAAGFLVVGPKVLLGINPQQQRMDVADEQLDTIGKAILGQTLGCARCHDHKFDPIPTADYYALAGIFTSTEVMERRYMLGQQRVMEQLVGLGPDGSSLDEAYEKYWRERPKLQARQQQAKTALELLEKQNENEFQQHREKHPDAVAPTAADEQLAHAERLAAQRELVAQLDQQVAQPPAIPPRAMIPTDRSSPADEHIRLAGQFDRLGDEIPRGFLTVVSDQPASIGAEESGRLALARWLTDVDQGAGRVAARVLANRIWQHMLGRGIVRTVDNFGRTGESPTHPELLDYLATRLIESGWSIKSLVREIALSRTFAMSSQPDEHAQGIDPANELLWRAHRQRLEPELLRDAMLLAAGQLDRTPMDSSVWYLGDQATAVGENKNRRRTDFPCRSIYLPVIRNDLPELFDVFNFADPHATTGLRSQTLIPTQGLYLLNDPAVMEAAEAIARRLLASTGSADARAIATSLYAHLLGRPPSAQEAGELEAFVESMQQRLDSAGEDSPRERAWTLACQAVLASSHFQILE